jgi:hypothetical protein
VSWGQTGFVEDGWRLAQQRYDGKEFVPNHIIGGAINQFAAASEYRA